MKVAFLGKGGSGKSTLAAGFVRHLQDTGCTVLAIDADHNMDLSFSLGIDSPTVTIGNDPSLIKRHLEVGEDASFIDAKEMGVRRGTTFSLTPPDAYTDAVTTPVNAQVRLMVAGPHTERIRSGEHCGHSLAAPLKAYLPLLMLKENEAAVIDERAGTDPVATGILAGVDLAVIVAEPTVASVRVANQIASELAIANVQYVFVANKVLDSMEPFAPLATQPIATIPFAAAVRGDSAFAAIVRAAA